MMQRCNKNRGRMPLDLSLHSPPRSLLRKHICHVVFFHGKMDKRNVLVTIYHCSNLHSCISSLEGGYIIPIMKDLHHAHTIRNTNYPLVCPRSQPCFNANSIAKTSAKKALLCPQLTAISEIQAPAPLCKTTPHPILLTNGF